MELNLAEKCTLQQKHGSYPITRALKRISLERDWVCDARGASGQEMVFARSL